MTAHGGFHAALAAAAGSPILERLRRQLYDASELYRMWSSNLPHHPNRAHVGDEHKAIFDAALARDADRAVDLLTQHLETTARHLEAAAPQPTTRQRRSTQWPADGPGPDRGRFRVCGPRRGR